MNILDCMEPEEAHRAIAAGEARRRSALSSVRQTVDRGQCDCNVSTLALTCARGRKDPRSALERTKKNR